MIERRRPHLTQYVIAGVSLITPFILFILSANSSLQNQRLIRIENAVIETDKKIFVHLTNDEIHTPKTLVITRAEFSIYQELRAQQMEGLRLGLCEIKDAINKKR